MDIILDAINVGVQFLNGRKKENKYESY